MAVTLSATAWSAGDNLVTEVSTYEEKMPEMK